MNRRGFLKIFAATGASVATNPVHFLAPVGGWPTRIVICKSMADVVAHYGTYDEALLASSMAYFRNQVAIALQIPERLLYAESAYRAQIEVLKHDERVVAANWPTPSNW